MSFILIAMPLGILVILIGGWVFLIAICFILALAGYEYVKILNTGDIRPSLWIVIGGILAFLLGRSWDEFNSTPLILTLVIFISLTYHLVTYERGRDKAAVDFVATVGGIIYFGWLGGYFISLRNLPQGGWGFLFILATIWIIDSGGYIIGRPFGHRPIAPRLSPQKTWEGFFGGILGGITGGLFMAELWKRFSPLNQMTLQYRSAIIIGVILAIITPLGDLGESMFKRQFGYKDSSHLIPGHGGVWDRIDSWLWGVAIGYYFLHYL